VRYLTPLNKFPKDIIALETNEFLGGLTLL
jgi:hypothetical protein